MFNNVNTKKNYSDFGKTPAMFNKQGQQEIPICTKSVENLVTNPTIGKTLAPYSKQSVLHVHTFQVFKQGKDSKNKTPFKNEIPERRLFQVPEREHAFQERVTRRTFVDARPLLIRMHFSLLMLGHC